MSAKISVIMMTLAPTEFLRTLTEMAIRMHRLQADDKDYELVVVEAAGDHFDPKRWVTGEFDGMGEGYRTLPEMRVDKYLNFTPPIGGVREANAAVDAATGDFVLFSGTDIIPPQGWDTELLRCFADRKDCGIASLSAFEPGATVGPHGPVDLMVEGMFSPFSMFRKGERYDEAYMRIYQDSDLVMRLYERGLRAFRSCRKHVWHLGSVTNKTAGDAWVQAHAKALAHDERLFYQRWGKSPLAMFGMIRVGSYQYGREYDAFTRQIKLHYDPSQPS